MDATEARMVLGVGPGAGTDEVRAAFRRLLRRTHPDVAPDTPGSARRTALLVQAYAVLRRLPDGRPTPAVPPPSGDRRPVAVTGNTLVWAVPPDETFLRLVEVADSLGDITYLDVDAGLLDVVVVLDDGTACSLMATVSRQPRPDGLTLTQVLFALEPLGAEAPPPAQPLVAAVAARLARAGPDRQSNSGKPQARRPT